MCAILRRLNGCSRLRLFVVALEWFVLLFLVVDTSAESSRNNHTTTRTTSHNTTSWIDPIRIPQNNDNSTIVLQDDEIDTSTFVRDVKNEEEDNSNNNNNNNDDDDEEVDVKIGMDDKLIQENPSYLSFGETFEDESDVDEETDEKKIKSTLCRALKNQNNKVHRLSRLRKLLQKHRLKLFLVAILFAFRREIVLLLWHISTLPVYDSETGKEVTRVLIWNPTSILKLILFIMLLWNIQQQWNKHSTLSKDGLSPTTALLLGRLMGHPFLGLILSNVLRPSSTAYVPPVRQHYTFERLNDRYGKDHLALSKAMEDTLWPKSFNFTNTSSTDSKELYERVINLRIHGSPILNSVSPNYNGTVIVLDWTTLDSTVSSMEDLRDEVTFLIQEFYSKDSIDSSTSTTNISSTSATFELVILLQSPGGSAADYALAAQQVIRLRDAGIHVTCCVDKIAASGGYMIACCASSLCAAPFAVLGSIGVYSESVNVRKVLEGWGVQPLTFRGGRDKAPVSLIGQITKEGIRKVQDTVDDTHRAFKRHVVESRPMLESSIDEIATGDVWLGYDALDRGLIDRIVTSDVYIGEQIRKGARVLKLCRLVRIGLFSRPSTSLSQTHIATAASSQWTTPWTSLFLEFRSLLDRASTFLGDFQDNGPIDLISSPILRSNEASSCVQASYTNIKM